MKRSLSILMLIFSFGCNINDLDFDNLKGPTLTGDVAIPLGELTYSMRELIDEVDDSELELVEDSISLLTLIYYDTANFDQQSAIIEIGDVSNNATIGMPVVPPGTESRQEVIDTTLVFAYPTADNEPMDSVFYKSGRLILNLESNLSSDINYNFNIINTREVATNNPVNFTGSLPARDQTFDERNLEGHKTMLTTVGDSNTFQMNVRITIFLGPGESTSLSDDIGMTLTYVEQEFDLLYGKFGQDSIDVGNEVLNVAFFEDIGESGLKFGDPEIRFNFENTYGLPLGISFRGLYGADSTSRGWDTTYLSGAATVTPQVVEAATTPGDLERSSLILNNQNSSIRDLLATSPKSIGFNLTGITNPEDASQQNFVVDSSRISTTIQVSLPMELSLENLSREIDFDLGSGLEFDEAETITARIVSENGLPFNARLELEILDENDSSIHTVPNELILETPFINSDGIVTEPRRLISDIALNEEGVDALRVGSKMLLRVILNSPASSGTRDTYVKVLADYAINVKVAIAGKIKAEL